MDAALRLAAMVVLLADSCLAMKVPFIRRYEPVIYDLEDARDQHHSLATRATRAARGGEQNINIQFMAMGKAFDLVLVPDTSIFHREFTVHSSRGPINSDHLKMATYTGHDRNTPGSSVHGNMISGIFSGVIHTKQETYYIEPTHRFTRDTAHHSIIYRHSDINHQALRGARCGLDDSSLVGYLERSGRDPVTPDTPDLRDRRQAGRDTNLVRCDMKVIGDYRFFQDATRNVRGSDELKEMAAAALLTSYVQQASTIFMGTDFDSNPATVDNIHLGLKKMEIETTPSPPPFDQEFIGVERFLRLHSDEDFEGFCLGYRFTHRDFDGGVLGLAYVANLGAAGGICQDTLNTGIVTTLNYGQRVPPLVTALTLTHEVGHNFGSQHDPEDNNECAPGGSRGNFIMYAFANTGQQSNNDEFSSCSREMMQVIIERRGQDAADDCFSAADDLCQNGFIDEGEACDCGVTDGVCEDDPCCDGTICQLVDTASCSPSQGPCCDITCSFLGPSVLCGDSTDCANDSFCNGTAASCPEPEASPLPPDEDFILCNNNTGTCVDNMCTGSFCVVLNTSMCICSDEDQVCDVCCMVDGDCVSTIAIAEEGGELADRLPGGQGQHLPVGTPCNDFVGYCDALNNCFQVDSEGALDRLGQLFSSGNVDEAITFIREKWWAVAAAGAGLLIGVFVLILIVHLLLPRPEHVKLRSERRSTIRRNKKLVKGGQGHGGYPQGRGQGRSHEMKYY